MHNMCFHVLLAAASLFSVLCLSETPPDSDQQSFCRSVEALELSIVSPLEGSYLLKGLVHFQFVTLAPPSDKLRYFVYVDEDPVIQPNSHGEDETVVFLGNESIGIHVDDVGMHVFSLVQTCSPSAWSEDGDEVDVRRVFVSFKALEATKTGRKMDGAQGADDPDVKYYLSAVAVFRDEEMYLQEWIEFHRCAGVDHFYLFNHHSSTDEYLSVLDPYIQQGIVDLDNATDSVLDENGTVVHHAQLLTFSRAVAKHQNETLWMAFIDIDEFLFAVGPITLVGSDGSSMELEDPSLRDVLPAYAEFGGVVVHWVMYGSSGYEETPLGLVIENYLWRAAEISPLFKSIAKPRRLVKCNNHNHEFQPGFFAVSEDNEIVPHNTSQNHPATARVFRINHYRCKSKQHLRARVERALRPDSFHRDDDDRSFNRTSSSAPRLAEAWAQEAAQNEAEDRAALRFLGCMQDGMKVRGVGAWNAFLEFENAAAGDVFAHIDPDEGPLLSAWVFGPAGSGTPYTAEILLNGSAVGTMHFPPIAAHARWSSASLLLPPLPRGVHKLAGRLLPLPRDGQKTERYRGSSNVTVDISVRVGPLESGEEKRTGEERRTEVGRETGAMPREAGEKKDVARERPGGREGGRAGARKMAGREEEEQGVGERQWREGAQERACRRGRRVGELEGVLGLSTAQVEQAVHELQALLREREEDTPARGGSSGRGDVDRDGGTDRDADEGEGGRRLGRVRLGAKSVSPLQEVYVRLHSLLHQARMLPIGVQPSTPHDGISDVWGIERGGAPVRLLIERFLDRVGPVLPDAARCLEWGRHYSQTSLKDVCNCGVGTEGRCPTSWSIEYGDCEEGWYAGQQKVCADVTKLSSVMPADDEGFDVIICTQVLEHVADPWGAMREMFKALVPGGQLVLTIPFMEQYHEAAGQFRDYWRWTHVGARKMLEDVGFQVDRLETAGSSLTATAAQLGFGIDDLDVGAVLEGSVGDYTGTGDSDWGVHEPQYQGVHVLASRPLDADPA